MKRRSLALGPLLAALLPRPGTAAPAPHGDAALARLAARHDADLARFDPVNATLAGDHRHDDRLGLGLAPAERTRRFAQWRRSLAALQALPRQGWQAEDQLTAELLEADLRGRLAFEPFPDHLLPLQQMDALPIVLAGFATGQNAQPLQTGAQHRAFQRRLAGLPAWLAQAEANLREGLRRGVVQGRAVMQATLPLLREMAAPELARNPFGAALRALPATLPPGERAALERGYARLVQSGIAPAMQRLLDWVERDYLPATREDAPGWGALPDGAAWYRAWVREQTTTALSPEAIHQLGLQEVARIQAALEALRAPLQAPEGVPLLAWARGEARFKPFRSEAEVLAHYTALNERIAPQLPRLFGRLPRTPLVIRPEPELTRATASDNYQLTLENGRRLGVFFAVINDPRDYGRSFTSALFLHEGQPGHHLQAALHAEMPLPGFRQHVWLNAYGEGWALYAETLGHELGLYRDDPLALLGLYQMEIARAARLVVDTGLHALGWSRAQAVAYWQHVVGSDAAAAARAIDRYLAWPGQALGYKIGALRIQQLRQRAEQALGPAFRLADFHDQVLGAGPLPLDLLERRIEAWLKAPR